MKVKMIKCLTIFLIPLLFVMGVMFLVTPQQQNAVFAGIAASGQCGDNVYYELSDETWPSLRIYGSGAMWDYDMADDQRPWKDQVTNLFALRIEEGITRIGNYAFCNAWNVRNDDFSIPSTVTSIGNYAFTAIGYLEELTIPNGVTEIGEQAFARTGSYTSLTIPASVQTIGDGCFYSSEITTLVIQNGVREIGDEAFKYCNISSISIPASVESLGSEVISSYNLSSISVDSNNQYYSDGNGSNCIIEKSTNTLLYGCDSTIIPSGVQKIANHAFYNCEGLTSVVIPEGVTEIGESAFEGCEGITTLTLPESLVSVGDMAFMECMQVTTINLADDVESVGQMAFAMCVSLQNLNIPAGVTDIGDMAFVGCANLTSITVDPNNTAYSDGNGSNCLIDTSTNTLINGCVNTVIPEGVEAIGYGAFAMTGISSITIPSSVTTIGEFAFVECPNLEEVIINTDDFSTFEILEGAFEGCNCTIYVPNSTAAAELETILGDNSDITVRTISERQGASTGVVESIITPTFTLILLFIMLSVLTKKKRKI